MRKLPLEFVESCSVTEFTFGKAFLRARIEIVARDQVFMVAFVEHPTVSVFFFFKKIQTPLNDIFFSSRGKREEGKKIEDPLSWRRGGGRTKIKCCVRDALFVFVLLLCAAGVCAAVCILAVCCC